MRRCLLTFLLATAALALLTAQSPERRLVLTNAKLLDVAAGRTRPVAALVVEGEKIVAIHATAPDPPLEGSSIRDLGGATLVPALADLAVQTQPGLDIDVDYFYAMSLAHGVMRVRAVDTHLPWAVAQRSRVGSGELLAPRVWTSGPLLDMRTPLGARNQAVLGGGLRPLVRVPDAASLGREAKSQAGQRVDWVRLGENVPLEAVRAAVAAARAAKVGVSVSPLATSMIQASQAGVPLIDGLGMPVETMAEVEAATRGKPNAPTTAAAAIERAWAQSTEQQRRTLIAQLRRAGTAVAPMLTSLEFQRGALANVDRDLAFLPERLRTPIQGRFVAGAKSNSDVRSKARTNQRWFVREFVSAGGRVVTASGAQADGWPIPGLGVHREIGQLIESGVSAIDALRAATAVSAEVLGQGQAATWRTGAVADFFAVKADPMDDIGALTEITLVVRAGEVLERAQLLQQARRAIRSGKK
jgi:imidazolonepropionase-like amidohydrolase